MSAPGTSANPARRDDSLSVYSQGTTSSNARNLSAVESMLPTTKKRAARLPSSPFGFYRLCGELDDLPASEPR